MSTNKFQYWPSNGQLGSTKFTMPTNAEDWPSGDALVGNFVFSEGKLVDFIDIKALVANSSKSTTFPYDYVNITVDKSLEGVMTFNGSDRTKYFTVSYTTSPNTDGGSFDYVIIDFNTTDQATIDAVRTAYRVVDKKMYDEDGNVIGTWDTSKLEVGGIYDEENGLLDGVYCNTYSSLDGIKGFVLTEFDSDLSSLTDGSCMFAFCYELTTFTSDLSSLLNGIGMFVECNNLTTFTADLSSLTDGSFMFENCPNLTTFTSDLSSLTDALGMFASCPNLTTFTSDLSSLTNGHNMFEFCYELTTFTADLSSLTDGTSMFVECNNLTTFTSDLSSLLNGIGMFVECNNLTTFTSDLSSLLNGNGMFYACKLDVPSVQNIAETINTVTDSPILHLGIGRSTATPEDEAAFQTIREKGWSLHVKYNPSTTSEASAVATLDETDETQTIPTVYWAKPVPSDEKHAHYIDSEGNYYNILGGNLIYVNDPDTYGMFINEEDAAAQMRLTKIERKENFLSNI